MMRPCTCVSVTYSHGATVHAPDRKSA